MIFGNQSLFGVDALFGFSSDSKTIIDESYDRLLITFRRQPNMRSVVKVWAQRFSAMRDKIHILRDGIDLETSSGNRLDREAAAVGVRRFGISDDLLRKKIYTQIDHVLIDNPGAPENLIALVQDWAGGQISYVEFFPREFSITAEGVDETALRILRAFVAAARMGGVQATLHTSENVSSFVADGVTSPVTGAGKTDGITTRVWGAEILTFNNNGPGSLFADGVTSPLGSPGIADGVTTPLSYADILTAGSEV